MNKLIGCAAAALLLSMSCAVQAQQLLGANWSKDFFSGEGGMAKVKLSGYCKGKMVKPLTGVYVSSQLEVDEFGMQEQYYSYSVSSSFGYGAFNLTNVSSSVQPTSKDSMTQALSKGKVVQKLVLTSRNSSTVSLSDLDDPVNDALFRCRDGRSFRLQSGYLSALKLDDADMRTRTVARLSYDRANPAAGAELKLTQRLTGRLLQQGSCSTKRAFDADNYKMTCKLMRPVKVKIISKSSKQVLDLM